MDGTKPNPGPSKASPQSDRWIAVLLLAVSAMMFYETTRFPSLSWDPAGMALWPRLLIGCLAVVCVWHIVKGCVGDAMEPPTRRALLLIAFCAAYLAGLAYLGFFIANAVMVAGLNLWYRRLTPRAIAEAIVTAIVATGLIYLVFEYSMGIEMPRGIWG